MGTKEYEAAKLLWRLVLGGGIPYLLYLLFNKIFEIGLDKYFKERPKAVIKQLKFLEKILDSISDMSQNSKDFWKILIYIVLALWTSHIYPLLILFAFMKLIRELSIKNFPDVKKWYLDNLLFTCTLILMFILLGNKEITSITLEIINVFKMK